MTFAGLEALLEQLRRDLPQLNTDNGAVPAFEVDNSDAPAPGVDKGEVTSPKVVISLFY